MENFIAYNPTRVHFGKNVTDGLGEAAAALGKKVLLVYGKGSVLRNGSYDQTKAQLNAIGAGIFEYSGIKPNPLVGDVDEAARFGLEKDVDIIVAVGGGSVIDSAKIIGVCIAKKCKGWDVMKNKVDITRSVPLIAVLTLAATGTEMNAVSVLQNSETHEKIGFRHEVMFPVHSFLDPAFTQSVPADYTAYGIVDLIAHAMENFFGEGEAPLSDMFVEGIIREAFVFGPELMNSLDNYDFRARMMWAATNALNGLTMYGRTSGDWGVHALGHVISYLYDTAHGATLSIAYPAWLKVLKPKLHDRISVLGNHLFNDTNADQTIDRLESFFKSIGSPVRLSDIGLGMKDADAILQLLNKQRASGLHYKLDDKLREEMVNLMV
ncbi:MAG: iron-containing alcohol dehydrogenase [Bacteroidales bacterium]|nr:iron-containing alcohol dehydrogenase [Bacteroidales bacterium]